MIVLVLALGVAANGVVYVAMNGLLLSDPAGIRDSELVRRVGQRFVTPLTAKPQVREVFSYPEFRAGSRAISGLGLLGGYATLRVPVGSGTGEHEIAVTYIVGEYFEVLGLKAKVGHLLSSGEANSQTPVAVISERLWSDRYRRGADIAGRIEIAGRPFTVVGVADGDFRGVDLEASDVWVPFNAPGNPINQQGRTGNAQDLRLMVILRCRGARELRHVTQSLTQAMGELNVVKDVRARVQLVRVSRLAGQRDQSVVSVLTRLVGATTIILLIACADVTTLLAVRALQRRREIAIRSALGMTPRRLLAQVSTESLWIAIVAATGALLLALWGGTLLAHRILPDVVIGQLEIDFRVVATVACLTTGAAMIAGIVAVRYVVREGPAEGLRLIDGAGNRERDRVDGLLGLQAYLTVLLLSGAVAFSLSRRRVEAIPLGYDADDVIVAFLPAEFGVGNGEKEITARVAQIDERLRHVPGVMSVAKSATPPMAYTGVAPTYLPGRDSAPTFPGTPTSVAVISPGFFTTMGVRLLAGRAFSEEDQLGTPPVALVSATTARAYWPGENPVGKCVIVFQQTSACRRVIGVVSDVKALKVFEPATLRYYLPLAQGSGYHFVPRALVIKSRPRDKGEVLLATRQLVDGPLGADYPWTIRPFPELFASELRPWRLTAVLFSALALLAMAVSAAGVFGTVSYTASMRRREIAIRRALGANWTDIVDLVMRRAVVRVAQGVAAGILCVAPLGNVLETQLYDVSVNSPVVLGAATILTLIVTGLACLGPIRSAIRVDPGEVIRGN